MSWRKGREGGLRRKRDEREKRKGGQGEEEERERGSGSTVSVPVCFLVSKIQFLEHKVKFP